MSLFVAKLKKIVVTLYENRKEKANEVSFLCFYYGINGANDGRLFLCSLL